MGADYPHLIFFCMILINYFLVIYYKNVINNIKGGIIMGNKYDYEEKKWKENFELAKEFKEKYGRFPRVKEEYKGVKLGTWLMNHKIYDRNNQERIELLKSIGVEFKE